MDKSKFHLFTYNFLFLLFVFLFLFFWQGLSAWFLAGLISGYAAVIALGAMFIRWNFFLEAVSKGSRRVKQIALTFDDAPSPGSEKIMNILAKHQVRATFFVIGKKIELAPQFLKTIVSEGHTVGNHSYSHDLRFTFSGRNKVAGDLVKCRRLIMKETGKNPLFFRPPFGVTNPEIAAAVRKIQLTVIGWSLRSIDTRIKNPEKLLRRLTKKTKAGDVILLHDASPATQQVLERYLQWLKQHDFKIVPLEQLINRSAYE